MSGEGDGAAGAKRLKPDGAVDTLASLVYTLSGQKDDMIKEIASLNKQYNDLTVTHSQLLQLLANKDAEIERLQSNSMMSEIMVHRDEMNSLRVELQSKDSIIAQHIEEKHTLESELAVAKGENITMAKELHEHKTELETVNKMNDKILQLHAAMGGSNEVKELINQLQSKLISISAMEEERCRQHMEHNQWTVDAKRNYFIFTYTGCRIDGNQLEDAGLSTKNCKGFSVQVTSIKDMIDGEMHFCKVSLSNTRTLKEFHRIMDKYRKLMKDNFSGWNMTLGPIFSFQRSDMWHLNIAHDKLKEFGTVPGSWICQPPAWIWTEVSVESPDTSTQPDVSLSSTQDIQQFQGALSELQEMSERNDPLFRITTDPPPS
jgi:hypothetical protein